MPQYTLITRAEFADKKWQRPTGFAQTRRDTLAPLVAQELPKAALVEPIGFTMHQDSILPVALQGLTPGQNLLVTPEGKWRVNYIPAIYRGYPFALTQDKDGRHHLCIDVDSGLIGDSNGEPLFDEQGQPTESVRQILDFLQKVQQNRQLTEQICRLLQQHDLIEPWPITLATAEGDKPVQGLYRIREQNLNQLDDTAFLALRQAGALPLIYCQLLSMQHLEKLKQLAVRHAKQNQQPAVPDIEQLFGDTNTDMFKF